MAQAGQSFTEADNSFVDEAYDSPSTTTSYASSIASYIREGVEENGRRYAAYGKSSYGLPIDEQEQDRNDLQHAKFCLVIGERLHLAPIAQPPQKVLDLGTGSGIWAIEMADQYEITQIIGVDIAHVQPVWVPPNCQFELLDIEDDWLFQKESFDFIHARELLLSIRDWPGLISKVYDHLKPGGWFEVAGSYTVVASDDGSLPEDAAVHELSRIFFRLAEAMGTPADAPTKWQGWVEDAGFMNVMETVFKVPQGPWPKNKRLKKIGAFENHAMISGLDAYMLRGWTQILKGDQAEIRPIMEGTTREMRDPRTHSYTFYYDVYGQKPNA